MMRYVWTATAILVALLSAAVAAEDEGGMKPIFPYDVRVETLDNGLRAIVVPMSSEGLVSYWTIVRTGSRDEYEEGRSGFAHFFEHMMFRGTKNYPAETYNRTLTSLGADTNAFTTDDLTAYHLAIAAEDLPRVMELESDRFRYLDYAEAAFRTEAGAVYGEYRKNRDNPFFALYEKIMETAYETHTYGHTTMGYERDIKNMPEMYDYSKSFFDRYYRPDNIVLLIVGDVEPRATFEKVRQYYGDWQRGYRPPEVQPEPQQREPRRLDVGYAGRTLPIVWIAHKMPAFDPAGEAWCAARLLADLAFGETSEIYRELVLEQQVLEFVAADAGMNRDPGLFDVYARVKLPDRVDYVLEQIEATFARYREQPPDAARLADLKSRIKYGFLMGLDTPDAVASNLARIVAITGGIEAVDTLYRTLDGITPAQVQQAARDVLAPERRTTAVLRGEN